MVTLTGGKNIVIKSFISSQNINNYGRYLKYIFKISFNFFIFILSFQKDTKYFTNAIYEQ